MKRGSLTELMSPNELYGIKIFTNFDNLDNLYLNLPPQYAAQLPILSQGNHGELQRTTAADSWTAGDWITD